AGIRLDGKLRPILATVVALYRRRDQLSCDHSLVESSEFLAGRRENVGRAHRQQLLPTVAQRPACRVVDVDIKEAGRVDEKHQVRRGIHRGAKAALFFFRALALQKLADLAPDHEYRLQQSLVGFADLAAVEPENADHLASRSDRKDESAAYAGISAKSRPLCARVSGEGGD